MTNFNGLDFKRIYFEHCECGILNKGYSKTMTGAVKNCYRKIFEHRKTKEHKILIRRKKINKILNNEK